MADTIRELIIQEIAANLGTLTGGSYDPPIGGTVIRADRFGLDSNIPGIALAAGVEEVTRIYRKAEMKMPVILTASAPYILSGDRVLQADIISTQAETMLGYLRAAMGLPVANAEAVQYSQGGLEEYPDPRNGDTTVMVTAAFFITYKTGIGDPYQ